MSSTQIIVLVVVLVVVVVLAVLAWMAARRAQLRRRFGPEYDRLVQEQGSRTAAERELRERERRHAELSIRPLPDEARARYTAAWEQVQAKFIDTPAEAVGEADALVNQVMADRGYPTGEFDAQAAQLSVEHGHTLGHYRDAHDVYLRNERGEATTEQLRQALVHYRALFADLLGLDPTSYPADTGQPSPATAEPTDETGPDAARTPPATPDTPSDEAQREERIHHA
jgi:hypothetical protein